MLPIRLFSARACPYAHRTRLVLAEKSVAFELVEIDLQYKPAWFDARLSGYGKVPALEHAGKHIWESAIIDEYLDEVFPEPRLLPAEPAQRAAARIWIDYANTRFAPAFARALRDESARSELCAILQHIDRGIAEHAAEGPYFLGAQLSLVDFTFYPWFERWGALQHYSGLALSPELAHLTRWAAQLRERPTVRKQENLTEYYIQRYRTRVVHAHQAVA